MYRQEGNVILSFQWLTLLVYMRTHDKRFCEQFTNQGVDAVRYLIPND